MPYVVESATFCPKKGRFAAGGEDMWVHLFDYATGEQVECNKGMPNAGCGFKSKEVVRPYFSLDRK